MSKEIGERLVAIANADFGGNQAEMSREMGMLAQGMNPYFQGLRDPGAKICKRLVELGYNLTWIFTGVPPMKISDITEAGVVNIVQEDARTYEEKGVGEVAKNSPKGMNLAKLTPEIYNNPIKMMSYMIEDFLIAWEKEGQFLPEKKKKEVLHQMLDIIIQQATNAKGRVG